MGDEEYNGGQLVIVAVIFLVITWISVQLRVFVWLQITKSFQADDWLMAVSQVCLPPLNLPMRRWRAYKHCSSYLR
jgi:hypothetical protein